MLLKFIFAILTVNMLISCAGNIPNKYQGSFEDKKNGLTLKFTMSSGTLEFKEIDRIISSSSVALSFKKLQIGAPGIYINHNAQNKKIIEVYWIFPDLETIGQEHDLVWYDAEVIHGVFDNTIVGSEALVIELAHCKKGSVMLDLITENWQVGCPESPLNYRFIRVDDNNRSMVSDDIDFM